MLAVPFNERFDETTRCIDTNACLWYLTLHPAQFDRRCRQRDDTVTAVVAVTLCRKMMPKSAFGLTGSVR
jgi:hypothetical protein